MRVPRIYHQGPLASGDTVVLDSAASNHVTRVLRLRAGARLVLFNGNGSEFPAQLAGTSKSAAEVRLGERLARDVESPLAVTLVQGISRGERMEYTIQKAVELGVSRIIPVETQRTVVALKGEKRQRRGARWQSVAIAACEQCGRNRVPDVAPPQPLEALLHQPPPGTLLMLDHRSDKGLGKLSLETPVSLLVGPEGGLSEQERTCAEEAGFTGIRLGPRILRTETAGLAALAALQLRFGDLG